MFEPTKRDPHQSYHKRLNTLRSTLLAFRWFRALRCLEFALRYHTGTRKDNLTPEFLHQVEQALYALTLRSELLFAENTICTILLHDTLEDYYTQGVCLSDIVEVGGQDVGNAVELMTNNIYGVAKPSNLYYPMMGTNAIASFAKGCDRMNNQSTMAEVSSKEKCGLKIDETRTYVFPMLKVARRLFPEQENAYQNVKTVLEQQVRLLEYIILS